MRKTVYLFLALIAAVLLFTGCENFLDSEGVSDQIKQNIKYANTTPCTIPITTETGSGIITKPAGGEAKVKPSDTFNLAFSAESDHQFLRWEIYDSATGKAIENGTYLKIEDLKMIDTTCNFVKLPENSNIKLAIRAITAVRPQIYLTGPVYSSDGSPRNSTLIARFDHSMDENSFYFSDEEKQKLKNELGITDNDFIFADASHNNVCYAYKKDGKKHYKNIEITADFEPTDNEVNVSGYSRDIATYYDVPFFTDSNKKILNIPAQLDPPIASFKNLTITIGKNAYYLSENNHITMRESKSWCFNLWGNKHKDPLIYHPDFPTNYNFYPKITNDSGEELTHEQEDNYDPGSASSNESSYKTSSDTEKIRLGFAFTAKDEWGCGLKKYFIIKFLDAVPDATGSTIYEVTVPYLKRRTELPSNSERLTAIAEAGTLDNIYWIDIPRNERLSAAKSYSFQVFAENHDLIRSFDKEIFHIKITSQANN